MQYEWQTPARQKVIMEVSDDGQIQVWLVSYGGEMSQAPALVRSHLEHWYRASCVLGSVYALAAEKQGELKHSTMSRQVSEPHRVSHEMDALCRHQQNANSVHAIRDIALSRALGAADKSMLGKEAEMPAPNYSVLMTPQQILPDNTQPAGL